MEESGDGMRRTVGIIQDIGIITLGIHGTLNDKTFFRHIEGR